ncbi:MAG: acyl carrier protein [archaeon]
MNQVVDIFKDVLDNETLAIRRETVAADVEEWDSLNHIQLIVATEKHFKIKFNSAEIQKWRNVGDMCDAIAVRKGTE